MHFLQATQARSVVFVGVNLAFAAFVLFFLLVPAAGSFFERADRIAESSEQLARIRSLQRGAPLADPAIALLPGSDEGSAGAALQSDLKSIVAAVGGKFVGVRGLEPTRLADGSIVGATIEVAGSVYTIRDIVRRIEDHKPVLIIRSALLRSRSADQDSELNVELNVEGLMQKGGGDTGAEANNARSGYGERGR